MYLNKAIIIGNLTRDPELKSLPSGMSVASFSIATNRVWKDKNGAKQESADFHNIVVFGKQAESCASYLKKGQKVLVEGRLQTRSWDAADGKKMYRTEILAERVQFGPKLARDGVDDEYPDDGDQTQGNRQNGAKKAQKTPKPVVNAIEYPEEDIKPEDIPF